MILGEGGRLTIIVEGINSPLSLSREKAISSVDPGGRGWGQIDDLVERINSPLSLSRENAITSVGVGWGN